MKVRCSDLGEVRQISIGHRRMELEDDLKGFIDVLCRCKADSRAASILLTSPYGFVPCTRGDVSEREYQLKEKNQVDFLTLQFAHIQPTRSTSNVFALTVKAKECHLESLRICLLEGGFDFRYRTKLFGCLSLPLDKFLE